MVMTGDDSVGILVLCVLGLCREYDVEEEDGAEMLSHLGDRLGRCPFLRGSTEGLFAGLGSGGDSGAPYRALRLSRASLSMTCPCSPRSFVEMLCAIHRKLGNTPNGTMVLNALLRRYPTRAVHVAFFEIFECACFCYQPKLV